MSIRTLPHILLAFAVALVGAECAHAGILYNEQFDYPNGNLVGQDSWTAHSSGGSKPIQVNNGKISIVQSTGSGEDVNKPTGSALSAGATWYAAFDVTVTGAAMTGTSGQGYFAHFLTGTNPFDSRVFITAPNVAGSDFTLGLSSTSSLAQTWPSDFAYGTTHRVVVSYDFDSRVNKLWIDPISAASPSLTTTSAASNAVTAFAFRQAAPNTPNTQVIDNLTVATTFAEALNGVPEPATIFLFMLGGLMSAALNRRRDSRVSLVG